VLLSGGESRCRRLLAPERHAGRQPDQPATR